MINLVHARMQVASIGDILLQHALNKGFGRNRSTRVQDGRMSWTDNGANGATAVARLIRTMFVSTFSTLDQVENFSANHREDHGNYTLTITLPESLKVRAGSPEFKFLMNLFRYCRRFASMDPIQIPLPCEFTAGEEVFIEATQNNVYQLKMYASGREYEMFSNSYYTFGVRDMPLRDYLASHFEQDQLPVLFNKLGLPMTEEVLNTPLHGHAFPWEYLHLMEAFVADTTEDQPRLTLNKIVFVLNMGEPANIIQNWYSNIQAESSVDSARNPDGSRNGSAEDRFRRLLESLASQIAFARILKGLPRIAKSLSRKLISNHVDIIMSPSEPVVQPEAVEPVGPSEAAELSELMEAVEEVEAEAEFFEPEFFGDHT